MCGSTVARCTEEGWSATASIVESLGAARTVAREAERAALLLYAGAVIMIGSTYLMVIDQLWLHSLVVAALSGAIAHILYLSVDLDDPFSGRWHIAHAPFHRARKAFDRATHLIDADAA